MPTRLCPICRLGKIVRREVKTCGAYDCVQVWKTLSPSQRARAVEEAEQINSIPTTFSTSRGLDPLTNPPPQSISLPKSSTQRDDEALRKMFGDDAPGQSQQSPSVGRGEKDN